MSRVREEARSPLGLTAIAPGLVTTAFVGLLALAAQAGAVVMAAAVLLIQLLLASAPSAPGVSRTPVRAPKVVPIAVAGLVAAVVTMWPSTAAGARGTTVMAGAMVESGTLAGIGLALPVLILLALIAQVRRPAPRTDVVTALGDVVTTGFVALLVTGWLAAAESPVGRAAVVVAAVVTVVALVADRARRARAVVQVWALAVCALVGIVMASWEGVNAVAGGVAAVAIAGSVMAGRKLGQWWRPLPPARWPMEVVAPIALAGPVVFVAALLWAGI
ncbi:MULTISPECIES: hypothetical protein [Mumia]|uniref:hypothetical protein n=1 Tax=Mumia TaxID=1546255 RepID=UPI001422590C|nr:MULTISPECIES: hypothetical protein [unclassified Mumia]QMW66863.1 hypothetical protein H4N58_02590 [Mumia sp. ZJ1417]